MSTKGNKKNASVSKAALEELVGPKLLKKDGTSSPTAAALKGKDLVALYFSASWCGPCKSFTPVLSEFYKTCAKSNGVEIIFVSSDQDVPSFLQYFEKMPWLAIPPEGTAEIINNLAKKLHIQGIPTLVILDAKTGNFVTDSGRNDVMKVSKDQAKAKELVQSWKDKEAVPIEEAVFAGATSRGGIMGIILFFVKNPVYMIGTYYLISRALRYLNKLGKEDEEGEL